MSHPAAPACILAAALLLATGSSAAATPPCTADGAWLSLTPGPMPGSRSGASLVWTGTELILWGGGTALNTGYRYDPGAGIWTPMSVVGAPSPRSQHAAVWTGSRMIVWGGNSGGYTPAAGGGLYDPATDSWTPMSEVNAPVARYEFPAVWTGSVLAVWGGQSAGGPVGSGGRYDPATDTWSPISTIGAPSPRAGHTAVWTGARMIVWGGGSSLSDGALYDPEADVWESLTTTGAPSGRSSPGAAWAGGRMVIWGGFTATGYVANGGSYDPATDTWTTVTQVGAPTARPRPLVVSTGQKVMVWGGGQYPDWRDAGALYDPGTDSWSSIAPSPPTAGGLAAAAGGSVFVWGMQAGSGGLYDPVANHWTPFRRPWSPPPQGGPSIWTGAQILYFPGGDGAGFSYDPQTDSYRTFSLAGAPGMRFFHTIIWTGSRMIVWGGSLDDSPTSTGGVYDPVADAWTPTSLVGAPSPRISHTAIWTGSRMVIWGGRRPVSHEVLGALNDGAMYDPETDTWTPVSTSPLRERYSHTAVWTGSEMLVWGGAQEWFEPDFLLTVSDGARYNPQTDTWSAMSPTSAPESRYLHSAVWTGNRMIVFGGARCICPGCTYCPELATGGRYSPSSNTWTPVGSAGTPPPPMSFHAAVWTGSEMIVHDGRGGRYAPGADSWSPVSSVGAPSSAGWAVWTGKAMATGNALYFPDTGNDADGDGYAICDGDCHDGMDSVSPEGIEVCNGLDDNCSGQIDEGGNGLCGDDGDPCTVDLCSGHPGCTHGDADADGRIDAACGGEDCDDANGWAWSPPFEVDSLEVTSFSVQCANQDLTAGPATRFDLVAGTFSGAPAFSTGVCLVAGNSPRWSGEVPFYNDPPPPAPGAAQWFLIRARNGCGITSWGSPQADAAIPPCN